MEKEKVLEVGNRVVLQKTATDLNGSEGKITELAYGPFGFIGYEVDFGRDVSKYTTTGLPTNKMVISSHYLRKICDDDHVFIPDYEALINLALATNDKNWFLELTEEMKLNKIF